MKRWIVLTLLLAALAANVSAHDQGDLTLNIETQLGVAYPPIPMMLTGDKDPMFPGLDFGLRGTVNYHLTGWFSVSAGLGYGFNYHWFIHHEDGKGGFLFNPVWYFFIVPMVIDYFYNGITASLNGTDTKEGDLFASYFTIPFGINFHLRTFKAGAGLIGNIPVFGSGEYKQKKRYYDHEVDEYETVTFKPLPYLGWYVDLGFDLSARPTKPRKFGMSARFSGAFPQETIGVSSEEFKTFEPFQFRFFTMSLVFNIGGFKLASLPIRGKQQAEPEPEPVAELTAEDITTE